MRPFVIHTLDAQAAPAAVSVHVPSGLLIVAALSTLLPVISAAIAREHWDASITGALTTLLAALTGVATEWARAGSGFAWQSALVTALVAWAVASLSHSKILAGTGLEAWLLHLGSGDVHGDVDPTVGLDPNPAPPRPHPTSLV